MGGPGRRKGFLFISPQACRRDETGLRVPGAGEETPARSTRRGGGCGTGAAPPASENKRDIQQWPVAASNSLGKGIVKSGCTVIAFKSSRTPPASHTWAAPRPRACVSPVSAGCEPGAQPACAAQGGQPGVSPPAMSGAGTWAVLGLLLAAQQSGQQPRER